ncbi:hypothetical protein THAOC_33924 [Thalassiosira oceanica]|uniref:Helicase-associated domain-containing protein n=1 Tax=Thalassiosira oceanica TaxID=159749 RepID=K0R603_THAOC|nr:hypothetical protein THAOC_33924 [Thalassiosira oceanica]|eukprot:EJK47359.1 hypothetical protein THAOC_33924 [Thalassiosira oceanica]
MGKTRRKSRSDLARQWNESYLKLKAYRAEHGDCKVPKRHGQLGRWVKKQRDTRKNDKLSKERIRKLDDLGFNWSPRDTWDERLDELKKYKADRGHCDVPQSQGPLGEWVLTQRKARKKDELSDERIRKLDDVGFNWSPRDTSTRQLQCRRKKGQSRNVKTGNCASSPESGSSPEDGKVGTGVAAEPDADVQRSYFDVSRPELAGAEENPLRDGADGRSSEPGEGEGSSRRNTRSGRIRLRSDGNSGEAAPEEDDGGDAPSSVPRRAATTPRRSGSSAYGNPPPDPTAGSRPGTKKRSPSLEASNPRTVRSRTRSESDMRIGDSAPAKSIARSSGSSDNEEEADPRQSSAMETELPLMNGSEAVVELVGNGSATEGAEAASDDEEQPGPDECADSDFDSGSSEFVLTNDNEGDGAPGSLSTGDKGAGMAASAAAEHLTSEQIKPVDGAAKSRQFRPSDEEDTAEDAGCPLETRLARAWTANEANTRAEELQNKVSSLSEAAAEMEDDLQLADAEASLAARECESLRADIERTDRLHEEELARAEAARDGDLADRDEAITSLETELARARSAKDEANLSSESLRGDVSRLQEELASVKQRALNAEEGRRVADQLLIGKQSEMHELESDYRRKEAELESANAAVERTQSEKNEMEARLGKIMADLQRSEEKLVAYEAAVKEGKVTITTLNAQLRERDAAIKTASAEFSMRLASSERMKESLQDALAVSRETCTGHEGVITELRGRVDEAKRESAQAAESLGAEVRLRSEAEEKLADESAARAAAEARLEILERERTKTEVQLRDALNRRSRELAERDAEVEERDALIASLKSQLARQMETMDEVREAESRLEAEVVVFREKQEGNRKVIAQLEGLMTTKQSELSDARSTISGLEHQLEVTRKQLKELGKINTNLSKSNLRLDSIVNNLNDRIGVLENEKDNWKQSRGRHLGLKNKYKHLERDHATLACRVSSMEGAMNRARGENVKLRIKLLESGKSAAAMDDEVLECGICCENYGGNKVLVFMTCCKNHLCVVCAEQHHGTRAQCVFCRTEAKPWVSSEMNT